MEHWGLKWVNLIELKLTFFVHTSLFLAESLPSRNLRAQS